MLNNFVSLQDWMIEKLALKGCELILYAVIYGFSQDGRSWFFGNLRYLEKWSGSSKSTVIRTLNGLIKKGLLKKKEIWTEDQQKQCFYQAIRNLGENKDYEEVKHMQSIKKEKKEAVEPKKAVFQEPTVEEVWDYCNERGSPVDPQMFVDFYTSKGWYVGNRKMVDWKAAVRTWEQKEKQQQTRPIMRKITDAEQREINYQNTMRNIAKVAAELGTMQENNDDRF